MPHAAYCATAVVLGGRLYVAGGLGCDKLQMWDGTAWTLKADLPAVRWNAASVAVDGKMWVIAGRVRGEGDTASVIIYNPETDSWTPGVPLPSPRLGCRATVEHTGIIFLVGDGPPLRFREGAWRAEVPALATAAAGALSRVSF